MISKNLILIIVLFLFSICIGCNQEKNYEGRKESNDMNSEVEQVKNVIVESYINGIHGDQNKDNIYGGFHPDFVMSVKKDDSFEKVDLDEWFKRIELMKAENLDMWSAKTTYNFLTVEVNSFAAVAKLEVFKGETFFSTDFMLLYKFEDGWKIVSKIFSY